MSSEVTVLESRAQEAVSAWKTSVTLDEDCGGWQDELLARAQAAIRELAGTQDQYELLCEALDVPKT